MGLVRARNSAELPETKPRRRPHPTPGAIGPEAGRGAPSLRTHLVALVLAVLLPALGLGAATAWHMAQNYRHAFEERLSDTARALATAADKELGIHLATVHALATSPLLDGPDPAAFRAWASEVGSQLEGWVVLCSAEPGSALLLHTLVPPSGGASPPGRCRADDVASVIATGRPRVTDVFISRVTGRPVVFAIAPLLRGGRVTAAVGLAVEPGHLVQVLDAQDLGGGAFASIVDGRGAVVARSSDQERFIGQPMPDWYLPAIEGRERGLLAARKVEGHEMVLAFARLSAAPGWTVVVAEPRAAYRAAWLDPLLGLAGGGILAMALAVGLAAALARRLVRPAASLLRQAEAVAAGLPVPPATGSSAVAEFDALRAAMERAQAARRTGEAEFRAAFEQSALAMAQSDYATGRYVRVNAAFCRLAGRPAEDLLGRHYSELTHPDDLAVQRAAIRRVARGEAEAYEVVKRLVLPDGGVRWVRVSSSPVRDPSGRPIRTVAIFQDITEARAAAAALRASEERLRLAQEAGGIGAWEVDLATGRRHWSESSYRLWGVEPGTPVTFDLLLSLVHPEDRERFRAAVDRGSEAVGPLQEVEIRIHRRSDGASRWLLMGGEAMADDTGRPVRKVGIVRDITAQKEAEAALRESEERLRLAVEAAQLGTWEFDLRRGVGVHSGHLNAEFPDVPPMGFAFADWLEAIHPGDRAFVSEAFAAAAEGRAPHFAAEFRVRRPGGGWAWIASRGAPVARDPATGAPVRIAGVAQDVTEHKAAEERQALLTRELDHRAKNALAVVQAALRLTKADDVPSFVRAVEGRVAALARAHTLLAEGRWAGAPLRALVEAELTAFLPVAADNGVTATAEAGAESGDEKQPPRVDLDGPALVLAPAAAQALSMALHELATNAVKYGALSVPGGRVAVTWWVDGATALLRLRWAEQCGPPLAGPPSRRGFGSRVIEATVRDQLGGRIEKQWTAAGLVCEIAVPRGRALAGGGPERDRPE